MNHSATMSVDGAVEQAPPPLFNKVLVANRGEIAMRIFRTLRQMGLRSVALFHAVDAASPHVAAADEAIEIRAETPVAAYLDSAQIIAAALACKADAIHPGYGFLSENADFAQRVVEAGVCFIGPSPETIRLMGDKISARSFAQANGVPVAPSVEPTGDIDAFVTAASQMGFPLLIKAAAGGGGKGMSIVRDGAELAERARVAASEAERYFGDGRVYAEVYVSRPRHIEVQILGDGQGRAIHLFERECSVQRRFQKVIEEAPAASLAPELRAAMCSVAVRLAEAARYRNAGTVEFVLGEDGRFFFLEMNTRLQVEHPVTEMITGIDLVRAQIEIAAGVGGLPDQDDVRATGHAIECRICAEDPEQDFMPQTGVVRCLDAPRGDWLRFESALCAGQKVTAAFDPMLAKLVAWGRDRDESARRATAALGELAILGVGVNVDYLARVINHPAFAAGALHTGFVQEFAASLGPDEPDLLVADAALILAALNQPEYDALAHRTPEPHATIGAWRN